METAFIQEFIPLLVFLIASMLIYVSLKKLEVPGTDWTHAILSFLLAFVFVSATKAVEVSELVIPWLITITIVLFLCTILFCFVGGEVPKYFSTIAVIFMFIAIIWAMFEAFPVLSHMLPGSSDSGLSSNWENLKDWLYSDKIKDTAAFIIVAALVGFFITKN